MIKGSLNKFSSIGGIIVVYGISIKIIMKCQCLVECMMGRNIMKL